MRYPFPRLFSPKSPPGRKVHHGRGPARALYTGVAVGLFCIANQPSFGEYAAGFKDDEPQVGFSRTTWAPAEGSAMVMWVILTAAGNATVTVDYATQPAADSSLPAEVGSDYLSASGTLTLKPGETSASFNVTILDDSVYEGPEAFSVELSNPQGAPLLPEFTTANVYIQDGDRVPHVVMEDVSSAESAGEVSFPVTLTGMMEDPVTMGYSTSNGTAIAGEDYTAASGTLSFASGETRNTIRVELIDDDRDEASTETFSVLLQQNHRPSNPKARCRLP